jgi:hypothetical protein
LNYSPDCEFYLVFRSAGVQHDPARLLGGSEGQVPLSHALVKCLCLGVQPVPFRSGLPCPSSPELTFLNWKIEEESEVGPEAIGGETFGGGNGLGVKPAAGSLVDTGGVDIPVGNHDLTSGQPTANTGDVLRAGGGEQQQLRHREHRLSGAVFSQMCCG